MNQRRREKNMMIQEWFDALLLALTFVLLLLLFVVRTIGVDGISMVPTLQDGDQLIVRSALYMPEHGDIVVVDGYTSFGKPIVKRVIGVGGDTVDIDFETGAVTVNGEVLEEPYISAPTTTSYDVKFPVTVPEGYLFLLGDNRPRSNDSRSTEIGFVDEKDILGKVIFRLLPVNNMGGF